MRRSREPRVEALEALTFLSVAMPAPLAAQTAAQVGAAHPGLQAVTLRQQAALATATATSQALDLSGTIGGMYQVHQVQGQPATLKLNGFGHLRGTGLVRMAATYDSGQAAGQEILDMALTTRRGTLLVRIQPDPSIPQTTATNGTQGHAATAYHVLGGTGAYQGATGSGVVTLALIPEMRSLGNRGRISLDLAATA